MLVTASEDIGLALSPGHFHCQGLCGQCISAGPAGGQNPSGAGRLVLATCPKSNSAPCAIDAAMADLKKGKSGDIPQHPKDCHHTGALLGRGLTYQYPHNYPNHYYAQQYLPDELTGRSLPRIWPQ